MKKVLSLIIAFIIAFSSFSALAINVTDAYNEFKKAHPDFIKSLTDEGISEQTIKDFLKDVDSYLTEVNKTTKITKSNFESNAMNAVLDISSREKYHTLQDTLLILYPEAIKVAITEGRIVSEFRPLVNTIKDIYFRKGSTDGGSGGGGGGGGGGSDSSSDEKEEPIPDVPAIEDEPVDTPPSSTISFSDLTESHWAYEPVIALANNFVLNGYFDGTFKPENNITRAEFAKIIVTATNSLDTYALSSFKDVKSDDWFYPYVSTAYSMGFITGYPDGSFQPNSYITRADICTIVNRVLKATPGEITIFKDDSSIPSYARDSVYALNKKGIINGYSDGTFAPLINATRAQTAKIIYGAFFKDKK